MKIIRKGVFETNSSSCHSIAITRDWDKPEEVRGRLRIEATFQLFEDYKQFSIATEKLSYIISQIAYRSVRNIPGSLEDFIEAVKETEEFKQVQKVVDKFYGHHVPVMIDINREYETPHSFMRFLRDYCDSDNELWDWGGSYDESEEYYISYYSKPENGNLFDEENEELLERLIFDDECHIDFFYNG